MDLKYCKPPLKIRFVHDNVPIKRPGQAMPDRGCQACSWRPFTGSARRYIKAVHLHKQLIQRLLSLVMTSSEARPPVTPYSIYLVYEDYARLIFSRLLEEIAHPRSAYTNEHLDEVEPLTLRNGTSASRPQPSQGGFADSWRS